MPYTPRGKEEGTGQTVNCRLRVRSVTGTGLPYRILLLRGSQRAEATAELFGEKRNGQPSGTGGTLLT